MTKSDKQVSDESAWPYASLFLFGFFDANTPGGRQLIWRTSSALGLFLISFLGLRGVFGLHIPQLFWVLAMPAAVCIIGWAYVMYLRTLDELSRRIQLEAFALAYGAVMVIFFGAVAFSLRHLDHSVALSDLMFLIIGAEPIRGAALVYLARNYK